jgi:hypothetical protein
VRGFLIIEHLYELAKLFGGFGVAAIRNLYLLEAKVGLACRKSATFMRGEDGAQKTVDA